ncbi:hypothetical protein AM587_10002425 [Phytophthora nicotianae]|uniref:Uncharacterized protein n=2 Tax=Phytophthora nicotianae TaxID=4792 RepID=A0A0W8DP41_PHYNI|nr:hypothetical protein AM587_10000893 [Phytophthora nicotianae]KUF98115.1 hypothetical protein AM587_10002425 [Phytophthora nicotianae]
MTSLEPAADTLNTEPSTPIRDWAISTTEAWTNEVKAEMRLHRRRACIARCREKTKSKLQQMRRERDRLEQEVKQCLAALNDDTNKDDDSVDACNTKGELCRLAHESDVLRTEAASLSKRLQQFDRFFSLVQADTLSFGLFTDNGSSSLTVREAGKVSKWVLSPNHDESGWQVCFPNGEPSFHFHSFTRAGFDDILKLCDDTLAVDPPRIEVAGSLLGWTVHRAPLTRRVDGSTISHARFTMRVACSLDDLDAIIVSSSLDSWPLVWTPPSWGYNERKQACCQVLQEFETDAYVLVHDIPGPESSRYISLAQRLPRQRYNGKRSITYVMVIADSEANARKCSTEQSHGNVQWVNEGGSYIKFTEVNPKLIDVRYDHWASCHDEIHAQHLFVRWAEFASGWSQRMAPSNLIGPEHQN